MKIFSTSDTSSQGDTTFTSDCFDLFREGKLSTNSHLKKNNINFLVVTEIYFCLSQDPLHLSCDPSWGPEPRLGTTALPPVYLKTSQTLKISCISLVW